MAFTDEQVATFNSTQKVDSNALSASALLSSEPSEQNSLIRFFSGKNENYCSLSISVDNMNDVSEVVSLFSKKVIKYKGEVKEPRFKLWSNSSLSVSLFIGKRTEITDITISDKTEN